MLKEKEIYTLIDFEIGDILLFKGSRTHGIIAYKILDFDLTVGDVQVEVIWMKEPAKNRFTIKDIFWKSHEDIIGNKNFVFYSEDEWATPIDEFEKHRERLLNA